VRSGPSLPVTTAGVPPTRPGRRRRPPRRYACPPARTRRAAEPGPQRVPAPFETTLRLRRDPGGTNENNLPRSVRSASEFILMSSRLSHWETTFSCTCAGVASRSAGTARTCALPRRSARPCPWRADRPRRGIRRADVVRLVDDDQAGLSRVPRPPQRRQDGLGDELLLRCRAERPQVDHRAPGRGVSQLRDERGLLWVPDAPVQQADVACPQAQRPSPREVGTASCAMSLISGSPSFWRCSSPPSAAYSSRSRTGFKPRTAAWVDESKSAKRSRSGRSACESSRHTATSFVTRA